MPEIAPAKFPSSGPGRKELATRTPSACGAADVEALRTHGFDDVAVTDAVQVIAYFNYINRVADCLGVDLEPEMR